MARELLVADRTAAAPGEGIDTVQTAHATHDSAGDGSASDSASTNYSKGDTRRIISPVARAMLGKLGALTSSGGGSVRLVRGWGWRFG
jgi:hypothetical protein